MDEARAQALLEFVRRNLAADQPQEVTVDTPLLSDQLVDSVGLTLLAAFIEDAFDVPFDGTELRVGRLESVREILALLDRRS